MTTPPLLITILTCLILLPWPMMVMMSPMMFDAPGSANKSSNVVTVIVFVFYPVFIFAGYWWIGWSFLGMSSRTLFMVAFIGILVLAFLFGYMNLLYYRLRKINYSGYSIKAGVVYYDRKKLQAADAATFELLSFYAMENIPGDRADYAKDKGHVYFYGEMISGADAATFAPIRSDVGYGSELWRDKHAIYHAGKAINGAVPQHFEKLPGAFWKDSQHVYFGEQRLDGAEADDVEVIKDYFLKTRTKLFYNNKEIVGADVASWQLLENVISKDRYHIYYCEKIILTQADVQTFSVINDPNIGAKSFFRDGNHLYYVFSGEAKRLDPLPPDEVVFLGQNYLRANDRIYHLDNDPDEVELHELNADTGSFKTQALDFERKIDASDKDGVFWNGQRQTDK